MYDEVAKQLLFKCGFGKCVSLTSEANASVAQATVSGRKTQCTTEKYQ